jgi:hypothetical protein
MDAADYTLLGVGGLLTATYADLRSRSISVSGITEELALMKLYMN